MAVSRPSPDLPLCTARAPNTPATNTLPSPSPLPFLWHPQRFPERWQPRIKALHRQLGLATWLLALATVQLALPHPAVSMGLITTAWQAGVAAVGGLMLLLAWKAGAANKAPESAAMKTV